MKYFLYLLIVTAVISCKKEATPTNIDIIGTWKMTDSYDNYKNPAVFQWNAVPDSVKITMQYTAHNNCTLRNNNAVYYSGNYTVDNATKQVKITSADGVVDYVFTITEYSNTHITVSYKTNTGTYMQKLIRE
jgi:hypothetical protein